MKRSENGHLRVPTVMRIKVSFALYRTSVTFGIGTPTVPLPGIFFAR